MNESQFDHVGLRAAISRWPKGGQRTFARHLREYAAENDLDIATSYRMIAYYVSGRATPSLAWLEAAAHVLRVPQGVMVRGSGVTLPLLGTEREWFLAQLEDVLADIHNLRVHVEAVAEHLRVTDNEPN